MDDDGEKGIVWMVDGEERPFDPVSRSRRPWLEESTEWGARDGGADDVAGEGASGDEEEPPRLEWI